jgi:hypothetical protein
LFVGGLTWWYFHTNVIGPVSVGYGFYLGSVCVAGVLACSIWALVTALINDVPVDPAGHEPSARR